MKKVEAFSLMEVLISLSILSLLMVACLNLVFNQNRLLSSKSTDLSEEIFRHRLRRTVKAWVMKQERLEVTHTGEVLQGDEGRLFFEDEDLHHQKRFKKKALLGNPSHIILKAITFEKNKNILNVYSSYITMTPGNKKQNVDFMFRIFKENGVNR